MYGERLPSNEGMQKQQGVENSTRLAFVWQTWKMEL